MDGYETWIRNLVEYLRRSLCVELFYAASEV